MIIIARLGVLIGCSHPLECSPHLVSARRNSCATTPSAFTFAPFFLYPRWGGGKVTPVSELGRWGGESV